MKNSPKACKKPNETPSEMHKNVCARKKVTAPLACANGTEVKGAALYTAPRAFPQAVMQMRVRNVQS